jgi:hypothetical protein
MKRRTTERAATIRPMSRKMSSRLYLQRRRNAGLP